MKCVNDASSDMESGVSINNDDTEVIRSFLLIVIVTVQAETFTEN